MTPSKDAIEAQTAGEIKAAAEGGPSIAQKS